jgi:hypothetical protein
MGNLCTSNARNRTHKGTPDRIFRISSVFASRSKIGNGQNRRRNITSAPLTGSGLSGRWPESLHNEEFRVNRKRARRCERYETPGGPTGSPATGEVICTTDCRCREGGGVGWRPVEDRLPGPASQKTHLKESELAFEAGADGTVRDPFPAHDPSSPLKFEGMYLNRRPSAQTPTGFQRRKCHVPFPVLFRTG